jgi:colanic acid/amylovoran biosynthesis protein
MHAAISTFQMLKPAISLSYSVKYRGVIGEGLGMNDLVIEAKGDDLWESGKIVDMVIDKVNYVLNNYDKLIERIKPAVEQSKKMALDQIKDIAEKLKNNNK